jgi:hypothetical protein
MAANQIRAFKDSGSGAFVEVDTEEYTAEDKLAVASINKKVGGIVTKSASFTLELAEAGAYIRSTSATGITGTVPPTSSVAFEEGTIITFRQTAAGKITAMAGVGVTLNGDPSTAGQHKTLQIIKVHNDTWDVVGGVA